MVSNKIPITFFDKIQCTLILSQAKTIPLWGLPLITYAPRGRGGGQASNTFLLRITCKKGGGGGGPDSM